MRILHLDSGRDLRGGQRQLLLLARGLALRGHRQVILTRQALEDLPTGALGALAIAAEARGADVIHAHDARAHSLAVLAAPGTPLVVSRRVAFPIGTGLLSRWKYGRAAHYLAVSQFVRGQLLKAGVAAERISVVYDGVPVPDRLPAVRREDFALASATDDPQKASPLAAAACRAAGIECRFSRRLEDELPRARLFLYLSHSEGLGSAILLAMAWGAPVVASAVGGIPEIVEDQRTGLLVPNQPAAVAAAVRSVLDDPAAAARLAAQAFEQVRLRFTDAIMVAQTEQAYRLAAS